MGVSKNRDTPKWMVKNGKPYLKMDDLGGTTIFGNIHILSVGAGLHFPFFSPSLPDAKEASGNGGVSSWRTDIAAPNFGGFKVPT